jgi:hypothetical protein
MASRPALTRQTVHVSHAASGRHRSPVPTQPWWRSRLLVVVVALLAVGITATAISQWPKDSSPSDTATSPQPSTIDGATPSPSESAATVETTSAVTVNGNTVTVEEVSTVLDGGTVRAVPAALTPLGLQLIDTSVIGPDGRSKEFDAPVTISASGTLTVRNRYRLTECPDLIPAQWPAPADFPGATRSYLRLDGPLHTASAICPEAEPSAAPLPALSGSVIQSNAARVRLRWLGTQTLTIKAIGSASGVAALVPNPDCDASCVASVASGGSSEIQLEPVDPCPPATEDERLTLVVDINGSLSTVAVKIAGLADAICS